MAMSRFPAKLSIVFFSTWLGGGASYRPAKLLNCLFMPILIRNSAKYSGKIGLKP